MGATEDKEESVTEPEERVPAAAAEAAPEPGAAEAGKPVKANELKSSPVSAKGALQPTARAAESSAAALEGAEAVPRAAKMTSEGRPGETGAGSMIEEGWADAVRSAAERPARGRGEAGVSADSLWLAPKRGSPDEGFISAKNRLRSLCT